MDIRFLLLPLTCMVIGSIALIAGIYFLKEQKFVKENGSEGSTEVELPFFGRLKTNYPSLITIFIGAALVIFPIYKWPSGYVHEGLDIEGEILREGQGSHIGTIVGVVPGRYTTSTDSKGKFTLTVRAGESSYTGIAYYKDSETSDIHVSRISIEEKKGRFNHLFRRRQ